MNRNYNGVHNDDNDHDDNDVYDDNFRAEEGKTFCPLLCILKDPLTGELQEAEMSTTKTEDKRESISSKRNDSSGKQSC